MCFFYKTFIFETISCVMLRTIRTFRAHVYTHCGKNGNDFLDLFLLKYRTSLENGFSCLIFNWQYFNFLSSFGAYIEVPLSFKK